MTAPSTIVLHDCFRIKGGGERLALSLVRRLADTLCYGYADRNGFDLSDLAGKNRIDLSATGGPFGWRTLKLLHAFFAKTTFVRDFDVAVYSGILAPVAVRNHPEGRNIFYCHTPPRFIYDQYGFHMRQLEPWKRPFMAGYVPLLRRLYETAVGKMDCILTNSRHVQQRVATYLGKSSVVVHPPCDTDRFVWRGQDDFYLSTARLEPLKRVDIIVRAFLAMPDRRLVVASGGSELQKLRALAAGAGNITFTGWTEDAELLELMGKCIATLYMPIEEDFGISPVESMSAGKPVIGVREGGLVETVLHEETGLLLAPGVTPEQVAEAVLALPAKRARSMREACRRRSELFSEERFIENMRVHIAGDRPRTSSATCAHA